MVVSVKNAGNSEGLQRSWQTCARIRCREGFTPGGSVLKGEKVEKIRTFLTDFQENSVFGPQNYASFDTCQSREKWQF